MVALAALAHGALGFGFPIISTPVIALFSDMRTAVLVTVLPNLVINVVSIARGGQWRASLGRYWPMAVWVLLGTVVGTRLLWLADPEVLKLVLAGMILLYLLQDRARLMDWGFILQHPKLSGLALGFLAGVLSGAVNVALPPLVVYFVALQLEPLAMTQILNLCFLVGKATQAGSFALGGYFDREVLGLSLLLSGVSIGMLAVGMRLQQRIEPRWYRRLVMIALGVMALLLVGQSGLSIMKRA